MFTRILVPTDFSKASDAALAHAHELARKTGATLHVLHVVDNLFLRAVLGDPRDYETAALRQMQDGVGAEGSSAILAVVRSDEPAAEIVSYASTHDVGLIVMGTHGRGRVAHLLLGSVAEKVARTAPCPVLTLHENPRGSAAPGPRILVPTDFSPSADAAIGMAKRLAAKLGGSIRLLHVVEGRYSATFGSELYVPEPEIVREEAITKAKTQLQRRMLVDRRSRVKISSDVVSGPSGAMIVTYAADNGFDLIVMGTRGRGGIAHLLLGSVAESVIRTSPCPVLTVKALEAGRQSTAHVTAASVAV